MMECYDIPCIVKYSGIVIHSLKEDINTWSLVNLAGQIFIVICGIVAALVIALNEKNKTWVKALGITASILVTGTTTLLDVLHVRENTDKLIDLTEKIAYATNKLEYDAFGKSVPEQRALIKAFSDEFNKLRVERFRVFGSAGKLNQSLSSGSAGQEAKK
jgi:hypothetical protein